MLRVILSLLMFTFGPMISLPATEIPPLTTEATSLESGERSDHFFSELMNMLSTLGIILLVLLILAWITRRMLQSRLEQANVSSNIKILERRSLAPRVSIYILEIDNLRLIVGETPAGLVRLGELSPTNSFPFSQVLQEKETRK